LIPTRCRTIQGRPKSAARKHAQALALSKGHIPRLWRQKAFSGSVKTGPLESGALPLERAFVWQLAGMNRMLRFADRPIPLRLARSPK
jgi:hypothetical protein